MFLSYLTINNFTAEPKVPQFIRPLNDIKITVGEPIKLEAQIIGFPSPEIQWFKDDAPIRPTKNINFITLPDGVIGLS